MSEVTIQQLPSLSRKRRIVNTLTRSTVGLGGVAVIAAIALIMGYLFWVVVPMFAPSSIDYLESHSLPSDSVLGVSSDDRFEVLAVLRSSGTIDFHRTCEMTKSGESVISDVPLKSANRIFPRADAYSALTSGGELLFFRITHDVRFDGDTRRVVSNATRLFDSSTVPMDQVVQYDVFQSSSELRIATLRTDGSLEILNYRDVDDFFELDEPQITTVEASNAVTDNLSLLFGPRGRWLYEFDVSKGDYRLINVASRRRARIESEGSIARADVDLLAIEPVLGRYSFLVSESDGNLTHWSLGPFEEKTDLRPIRTFSYKEPIVRLVSEHRRKGFIAIDQQNTAHLGFTTSKRQLASVQLERLPSVVDFSPRADRLITVGEDEISTFEISNKHPEVSWATLWGKVWFEGYEEPVFSWQSSSADTDFEAKFSLTPLLFGTIKAAFYAMLVATPLAIMGAIYTAVFMSPGMRRWIKPGIEIMAALPTVILGFLAGLWLAPIVESNLTSIMLLIIVLPLGVLLAAFFSTFLPSRITARFDGWFGAITVPILVLIAYFTITNDEALSSLIFGMDAKVWFYERAGIEYDQRNALIIGIAMGLAVIPTIFAISEDAIYGVPQHLVHGSLALGATRWQTLIRVILLTASPGIFSAVMIGLGRAVGETMIVLMATGNTPIMDVNLFQGMRTFAANIAVEMPESEVGSSHFRILFLTAFVLFVLTFLFNTVAEVVRQRLRSRYGNL